MPCIGGGSSHIRYLYIRFLRMRSSPGAIARGASSRCLCWLLSLYWACRRSLVWRSHRAFAGNKVVASCQHLHQQPADLRAAVRTKLLHWAAPAATPCHYRATRIARCARMTWVAMGKDVGAALLLGSPHCRHRGQYFRLLRWRLRVAQKVQRARAAKRR